MKAKPTFPKRYSAEVYTTDTHPIDGMKAKAKPTIPKRYDVVIYEVETRVIDTIAGTDLLSEDDPGHGFHTVEKRLETVLGRLNEHYDAIQVPAGKYKKGDVLPKGL
jgi:hypothetical protein